MITVENLHDCANENLAALVPTLDDVAIGQLVAWLSEKDDNFRYKCFLLLRGRSQIAGDVYPYWDVFVEKLGSANSYQRSLGLMLIAENVRWDQSGRFDEIVDAYLAHCDDEKAVTVRQCIQGLNQIVSYNANCRPRVVEKLTSIDLMTRKDTQRKILLVDILTVLCAVHKLQPDERIERYLQNAMTGGILDPKSKRMIAAL